MTERGRGEAAASNGEKRRTLLAVETTKKAQLGGFSLEQDIFSSGTIGAYHLWNIRSILKKWCQNGLLERRLTHRRGVIPVYVLKKPGAELLDAMAARLGQKHVKPTRTPRMDSVVHHLLVVEAAIRETSERGGRFLRLLGDEDMRSSTRAGKEMKRGDRMPSLPDGRLRYQPPDEDIARWLDIEILISKYTDEAIIGKYEAMDEDGVRFYSPTPRLVKRVERITGRKPLLLI